MQVRGIRIGIDENAVFSDFCGYFGIKPLTFVHMYDKIALDVSCVQTAEDILYIFRKDTVNNE